MAAIIGNRNITLGVMGGTLITAACYGGGEVFGCSPYDAATTAYLKATYPSHWQAIRNFGFDNPQLVPWINEDNDLIVSLVGMGKVRTCKNDNTNSYFKLGVNGAAPIYLNIDCAWVGSMPSDNTFIGSRGNGYRFYMIQYDTLGILYGYNDKQYANKKLQPNTMYNIEVEFKAGQQYMKIDGETVISKSVAASYNSGREIYLFCCNYNGAVLPTSGKVARCILNEQNQDHTFVPFKRNGQMELLDIVTGTLATRVGTFTELIE